MKAIKYISMICMTLVLCLVGTEAVYAKGIVNDGLGIRYQLEDGTFAKSCRRYVNGFAMHFNENGYMDLCGFDALAGSWKNTKKGKRYMFVDGRVPVGGPWLLPDGQYYTFDDDGYLVTNASKKTTNSSSSSNSNSASSNLSNSKATTKNTTKSETATSKSSDSRTSKASDVVVESSNDTEVVATIGTEDEPSQTKNKTVANGVNGNGDGFNTYDNEEQQQTTAKWVLNTDSKKIHLPSCDTVRKISPENYATSNGTFADLMNQGYSPCGVCNPQ